MNTVVVVLVAAFSAGLPDPLVMESGRRVETAEDWQARRAEMLHILQHWQYGHAPPVPEIAVKDVRTDDVWFEKTGQWARLVRVSLAFDGLTMEAAYWKPRDAAGPLPALLAMEPVWWPDPFIKNGIVERVIERGFILAGFDHNDLASFENPSHHPAQDAHPGHDWGVVAVGAWGYRVAMNWLETDPSVDVSRVAIWGHSRRGKSCALAGGLDQRFAAVIPHMSGMGGTALYRVRGKGAQKLEQLLERFWLNERVFSFIDREQHLPFEQHWLHALIAPRPLLVHTGKDDAWGNPHGEKAAIDAAKPVYDFLKAIRNLTLHAGNYGHHDPNGPEGADSWETALDFLGNLEAFQE